MGGRVQVSNARRPATGCRRTVDDHRRAVETIVSLMRCGQPLAIAAAAAGVPRSTVYSWLRRGERAPGGSLEHDFWLAIVVVRAQVASVLAIAVDEYGAR